MNRSFVLTVAMLLVVLGVAALGIPAAQADTIALQSVGPLAGSTTGNYNYGYRFSISQDIYITALGIFDANGSTTLDGGANTVSIYAEGGGAPVVQGTVTGSSLSDGFFWNAITSVLLPAGNYRIAIPVGASREPVRYTYSTPTSHTWAPEITWVGGCYGSGSATSVYPNSNSGLTGAYIGPNFRYLLQLGATITAKATTGIWKNGSAWVGETAPTADDSAVISHTDSDITVDANAWASGVSVGAGSLTVNASTTLTVSGTTTVSGGTLDLYGKLATTTGALQQSGGQVNLHGTGSTDLISNTAAVSVSNGTFDLGGVFETVGSVTVSGGTVRNGTLTGSSYDVRKGTISANLAGSSIALAKSTADTVELAGTNTYTGSTTISGGILHAVDGVGLPTNSLLVLSGGVLQSSGTISRPVTTGTSGNGVKWTASSGFAAQGAKLNVDLGSGSSLTWGSSGFVPAGNALVLGSSTGDNVVEFKNDINLNDGIRTIQVDDNSATNADYAELSGALTSTTPASGGIIKTGAGLLKLTGANTYAGPTTVSSGVLEASFTGDTPSLPGDSKLVLNGGVFQSSGILTRIMSNANVGELYWTGSGGFAASGGDLAVDLSVPAEISKSGMSYVYGGAYSFNSGTNATDPGHYPDPAGGAKLLDGTIGSSSYSDGKWVGINYSTAPVTVDFALGDEYTLTSVSSWYYGNSSTISAPGTINVYTKVGEGAYELAGSNTSLDYAAGVHEGVVTLSEPTNATDVRLEFTIGWPEGHVWLFISEMAFYTGVPVSHGQLSWGDTAGFLGSGQTLMFGSATADHMVEFKNDINLNNAVRTVDVASGLGGDYAKLSGVLSNGSLTKTGNGLLELSNTNTYTGATTVSAGTLRLSGSGSTNTSSGITINGAGAKFITTSSIAVTAPITLTMGTLGGTGTIGTLVTVGTNGILSPGTSPGTQNFSAGLTWNGGGSELFEINDVDAGFGVDPGWDLITVSGGTMTINATSLSQFNILLTSLTLGDAAGIVHDFSNNASYTWKILDAASAINGFTGSDQFNVVTTAFLNPFTGSFSVVRGDTVTGGNNKQLYLKYVPLGGGVIPEPAALGLIGLALLALRRRRTR